MECGRTIRHGPNAAIPVDFMVLKTGLELAQILLLTLTVMIAGEVLLNHNLATVLIAPVSNI